MAVVDCVPGMEAERITVKVIAGGQVVRIVQRQQTTNLFHTHSNEIEYTLKIRSLINGLILRGIRALSIMCCIEQLIRTSVRDIPLHPAGSLPPGHGSLLLKFTFHVRAEGLYTITSQPVGHHLFSDV